MGEPSCPLNSQASEAASMWHSDGNIRTQIETPRNDIQLGEMSKFQVSALSPAKFHSEAYQQGFDALNAGGWQPPAAQDMALKLRWRTAGKLREHQAAGKTLAEDHAAREHRRPGFAGEDHAARAAHAVFAGAARGPCCTSSKCSLCWCSQGTKLQLLPGKTS